MILRDQRQQRRVARRADREYATVLPLKSSIFDRRIRRNVPVEIRGARHLAADDADRRALGKVPTAADTPEAVAMSMLPPIRAWIDSGPAEV